MQTSKIDY